MCTQMLLLNTTSSSHRFPSPVTSAFFQDLRKKTSGIPFLFGWGFFMNSFYELQHLYYYCFCCFPLADFRDSYNIMMLAFSHKWQFYQLYSLLSIISIQDDIESENVFAWKGLLKAIYSTCSVVLRSLFNLTLNASKNGASTVFLGNLFQCFTALMIKKKILPYLT